jgi:ribosome biogenesis GTPase / thiamine phosphate phosphatase
MSTNAAADRPGRVVAAHGRRVVVAGEDGAPHPCVLRGRQLRVVCGDRVRWRPGEQDGEGLVLGIEPRTSALERPDARGRREVLAANVTQLIAVFAPRPPADPFLIDRYLAAAELMPCSALLLRNKIDLEPEHERNAWWAELERIGYRVLHTSMRAPGDLAPLHAALAGHTSILVGQSGVGKSSLLNALVPGIDAATAALSAATGLGRHTTTAAVLHGLPGGGSIIDSPGVRDYAPPPVEPRAVARGFVELAEPALECRFGDCLHRDEPGCGVKRAAAEGRVSARRYESYLRLLRLMEDMAPRW